MSPYIIGVGVAGHPPTNHPYNTLLEKNKVRSDNVIDLPPMLAREKKVEMLVKAAGAALLPLNKDSEDLRQCGVVTVTQWDGRFPMLMEDNTTRLRSFRDVSPSSIAFTLVPHVAASCINIFYNLQGPSLSLSSNEGIKAAIDAAIVLMKRKVKTLLVVESDLALPDSIIGEDHHAEDYAIAFLLSVNDLRNE